MTNIYVGNLSPTVTEEELERAFAQFGKVLAVSIVKDRETGQPRGFAFVEMADRKQAAVAIAELNLRNIGGRPITLSEARPKPERPRGGGGRRRGW
jgi:RNA recognition motif-containing protein